MTPEQAAALRAPFPPEHIGHLPKGGVQLAFVGHAHVTDRLLQVDPAWYWEPMGMADNGLPMVDDHGNLWIRLTVCDVTRIGVGDGVSLKEKIGDAIRNAAMRFGVALDLWAKETPVWDQATEKRPVTRSKPTKPVTDEWSEPPPDVAQEAGSPPSTAPVRPHPTGSVTTPQLKMIQVLAKTQGVTEREDILTLCSDVVGRTLDTSKQLTKVEASAVIDSLNEKAVEATRV